MITALLLSAASVVCWPTDGDSIRCGPRLRETQTSQRYRLLGIDTPETGKCPARRRCASGDPKAALASLRQAMVQGTPAIRTVGRDRYGRLLAQMTVRGTDLSCWQLRQRVAVYRADWDNGRTIARTCPSIVRTARTP